MWKCFLASALVHWISWWTIVHISLFCVGLSFLLQTYSLSHCHDVSGGSVVYLPASCVWSNLICVYLASFFTPSSCLNSLYLQCMLLQSQTFWSAVMRWTNVQSSDNTWYIARNFCCKNWVVLYDFFQIARAQINPQFCFVFLVFKD